MEKVYKNSNLMQILQEVPDFRNPLQITYELSHILAIAIIGVMVGLKHILYIGEFAKTNIEWFKIYMGIEKTPSHDTILRALQFVNYNELESALSIWLEALLKDKYVYQEMEKRLTIDGKKISKLSDGRTDIVRAFKIDFKQVICGIRIQKGEGEITTIPKLLKKLSVKGYLISIDAIGTHVKIAKLIVFQRNDYLLPVKLNQKTLYQDLDLYIDTEMKNNEKNIYKSIYEKIEYGHGRIERRIGYAFSDVGWLHERHPQWDSIKSYCMLVCIRQEKGKASTTTYRIFISSRDLSAQKFIDEIRKHWSIENQLHWPLNQSFSENKILAKDFNCIFNFSTILSSCLTLISNIKSKNSFTLQKCIFSWNLDLLKEVLF